jgi:ankyrin repeat protein
VSTLLYHLGLQYELINFRFLLARLYVDSLLDKRTKSKVLSTLEDLSGGSQTLERAYEDATRRLKSQLPGDAALAIRVISWIVYAKRSLTTTELRHALAVEPGKDHLDLNNLLDIEDIVSVCAGLVTIDTYSEVVRLVHYTTHEYFEGIREYWNPDGQLDITHTCLTYLSFAAFRYCSPPSYANSNESLGEFLGKHPFLDYAARYWGWSTVKYQSDPFDLACTVLRNDRIVSCIRQVLSGAQYKTFHHGQNWGKGLHVLAELGMKNLAERMFISFHADTDSWIVEKDHQGSTCLYVAVEHEQESMVRLFLDKGADVNAQGGKFGHVLSAAVYSRNERIVKLLIDRGAIVDRDSQDPNNAFRLAFRESSDEMAKLLLEANADTGMTGAWSQTLLCLASEEGWYDVVKILLSRAQPRSLNARDVDGWTPLAKACFNNRIDVVTLLLNEGADANICISEGLTPLHAASDQSHLEVVQLLLDNGADLNTQDQHGQTPLHSTISKGNLDVVELLLRKGADLDVLDESARRLINDASNEGRIEVIKLLLNRGCRVEFSNEDGWIPFYLAATHGHLEVVKLLLNQGTDIPTFANLDSHGRHILHITAAAGHLESCLYLIGQGIDPLARDAKGDGLLSYAASSGSLRVFEMALSLVPVSSVQTENWSPLHWACRAGNSQIIELLTQSGMRGNCVMGSQLYCNWSPIDIAMHHGHIRMLEDLSDSCKVALGPATGAGRVLETYRCYAICDGCLQVSDVLGLLVFDLHYSEHLWPALSL